MKFLSKNVLISGLTSALAIVLSSWGLRPNYFFLFISALFATAVYVALSWKFIFSDRERQLLLSAVQRGKKLTPNDLEPVEVSLP
jgi:ABC-type sugar transport system permease subunit